MAGAALVDWAWATTPAETQKLARWPGPKPGADTEDELMLRR